MARLLGAEVTSGQLAVRAVLAVVFGGLAFLVFYYLPVSAAGLVKQVAGPANASVASVVNGLVSPDLPAIGAAVAALVFLGVFLRGTKAYGPILIAAGAAFLAYFYVALQGGTITLALPQGIQYSASGNISIGVADLMYLLMVAPALTIVKGAVLTATKPGDGKTPPA
ncbi:MAG: hypothetical protein JRN21_04780 [Nitrososphaerota archaeon]|nr:hypothetical protein [Nitrososphaerota archaeon]